METFWNYIKRLNPGPVEHQKIGDYLNLPKPHQLALIAASLAPKEKTFRSEDLIAKSLSLLKSAEIAQLEIRRKLVAEMNSATLLHLHMHLHGPADRELTPSPDSPRKNDALAIPLIDHFRHLRDLMPGRVQADIDLAAKETLKEYGGRKLPIPCSHKNALLYAARENPSNWIAVEKAFIEKLELDQIDEMLISYSSDVPKVRIHSRFPQDGLSRQDRITKLKKLRDSFKPNLRTPDTISEHTKCYYKALSERDVKSKVELARLCESFGEFWKRYGAEYLNSLEVSRTLSKTRADAQREATKAREAKKWNHVINSFLNHLADLPHFPRQFSDIESVVEEFCLNGLAKGTGKSTAGKLLKPILLVANESVGCESAWEGLSKEKGFSALDQLAFADWVEKTKSIKQ